MFLVLEPRQCCAPDTSTQTLVVLLKLFFPPPWYFPDLLECAQQDQNRRPIPGQRCCGAGAEVQAGGGSSCRNGCRCLCPLWPGLALGSRVAKGKVPTDRLYVTGAFRARSRRLPAAWGWLEQDSGGRGPRPQAGYLPAPAFALPSAGQALSQSRPGAAGTWRAGRPPLPRPWGKGGACPHAPGAALPSVPWRGP